LEIACTGSSTRSASTRLASECEWTVLCSLANTAVAYSTSVCVLHRVCIRVRVRSLHERTATSQSDHSHNRPPPQHLLQLLRLRYTATHTAPTTSPLSPCPPHSLPLSRPVPPLNRSSVSRVGRALASEASDDGPGPTQGIQLDEHFPTPADCLCGPASPKGVVKRRPRPVAASRTALCTGQPCASCGSSILIRLRAAGRYTHLEHTADAAGWGSVQAHLLTGHCVSHNHALCTVSECVFCMSARALAHAHAHLLAGHCVPRITSVCFA
jgi:hypothetical protein